LNNLLAGVFALRSERARAVHQKYVGFVVGDQRAVEHPIGRRGR
jgi:hypothetical protein